MKKQSFLFGSLILVASGIIVKIIGAVFKIPLTNMLGGTAMGYFSLAYGIFLPIYAVLGNGLGSAIANLTAQSAAKQNYADVRKIRKLSLLIFGISGFLISLVIFIFAKPFAENILASEHSYLSVAAIAPCVFFASISSVIRGYHEGLGNMYPTAISQVIEAVAKLFIGLFGANFALHNCDRILKFMDIYETPQALAAAGAICGVSFSTLFGAFSLVFHNNNIPHKNSNRKSALNSSQVMGNVFCVMLPIALGALVTNLTSLVDLFTINRILGKCITNNIEFFKSKYSFIAKLPQGQVAGFTFGSFSGLAITIFNLVPSVTNMLSKSVLSSASQAYATNDSDLLNTTAKKAITLTSLISAPCAFGIAAMSKPILTLLYSQRQNEVEASYMSLTFLGISVVFLCLSSTIFSLLQGTSNAVVPVKIMLLGVAVKFIFNIVFLSFPQTAIFGAAISTLLCYIVIFALSVLVLKNKCKISLCAKETVFPFITSGICCAISAKVAYALMSECISANISCVASIAMGGIVYIAALLVMMKYSRTKKSLCEK